MNNEPAQEVIEQVWCGHGCACMTDCGDAYELHGEPKPPKLPTKFKTAWCLPAWWGRFFCWLFNSHDWAYSTDEKWRVCYCCRKEQRMKTHGPRQPPPHEDLDWSDA